MPRAAKSPAKMNTRSTRKPPKAAAPRRKKPARELFAADPVQDAEDGAFFHAIALAAARDMVKCYGMA